VASYYPISPLFWSDDKVRSWIAEERDRTVVLALYLLTCEHRNLEGLYRLPKAYVIEDLGWEADAVGEHMARLLDDEFIEYDESARVVFVRNALKYQQPKSPPQIKGAINSLERVPETPLLMSLLRVADTHALTLSKAIRKTFKDRLKRHGDSHA
jgi:hypothetical protein